jgi:hypothetical protein
LWAREVRGIEREDRDEPITHSNRLIEREIGGLGGKLGAREKRQRTEHGGKLGASDKGKRGKREGNRPGGQGNQIGREEREEGAPLKLLAPPPPGAALSKASPCNPP